MADTQDVTLFYLPSAGTAILPSLAYGTGWNKTSQAARFPLVVSPTDTPSVERTMLSSATSPEFHLSAQFQIPRLAAQTFGGTLSGQIRSKVNNAAFAGTIAIAARVVSRDGLTIRGHLIGATPGASTAVVNPPQLITSIQNRKFRDSADVTQIALTGVTAEDGDVLVIEIGVRDVDSGTSRSAFLRFQDLIAGGNLPEDDTTTTALNPWIRFSQAVSLRTAPTLAAAGRITFSSAADLSVTSASTTNISRFYLPSTGTPPLAAQAYGSGWNKTSQATRLPLQTSPSNTSNVTVTLLSSATTPEFHLGVQYQISGLAAQTFSGTLKGQIRAAVNNVLFVGTVAIAARVVSADGSTVRGQLIGSTPAASTSVTTPPELNTSTTNRSFRTSADATALTLTGVVAQAGDVLIIEIGARDVDSGTSRSATLRIQDLISGGDLPEDETTTTALNPWVEFSTPVQFNLTASLATSSGLHVSTAASLATTPKLATSSGFRVSTAADLLVSESQPLSATFALRMAPSATLGTLLGETVVVGGTRPMTVLDLITRALQDLRVYQSGEALTPDDAALGLSTLNDWIDSLANEGLTLFTITRTTWTITTASSYTIGLGATINVARPIGPDVIESIGYQDTAVIPTQEYKQGPPSTEAAYAAIPQKGLTALVPQGWYYNPTFGANGFGTVIPWPTPTSTTLQGVIYTPTPIAEYAALTDIVALPPGYRRFLRTNVAKELAAAFDSQVTKELQDASVESKRMIKRANQRSSDLSGGLASVMFGGGSGFDIWTDS